VSLDDLVRLKREGALENLRPGDGTQTPPAASAAADRNSKPPR
jgi:hypothetical protein